MIDFSKKKVEDNDVEKKSTLAKLLATENIEVQENSAQTASFDVKDRILTIPIFKKEHKSKNVYDMLVGHEVAHALWTPTDSWIKMKNKTDEFRSFVNVLEDCRIDKKIQQKYPGLKKDYLEGFKKLYKDNFFKTKGRKLNDYLTIDKINLYFKSSKTLDLDFDKKEKIFVKLVDELKTFEDVKKLAEEILGHCKNQMSKIPNLDTHATADIYAPPKKEDDEEEGNSDSGNSAESKDDDNKSGSEKLDEFLDKKLKEQEKGSSGDDKKDGDDKDGKSDSKEKEKKEDNQSKKFKGFSNNAGGQVPIRPVTADSYEEARQKMADDNISKRDYCHLPKVNLKKLIISNKDFIKKNILEEIKERKHSGYGSALDEHGNIFKKFIHNSTRTVNYLVKEFEMKKNARLHARASTAKTGVIDPLKLYSYKYAEDIFKKITIVPNEKNHGMIFLLDWSGSMSNHLLPTVEQLLNLVLFARKINIPFSVYMFLNNSYYRGLFGNEKKDTPKKEQPFSTGSNVVGADQSTKLVQLFSHKQSKTDMYKSALYLHRYGVYYNHSYARRKEVMYSDFAEKLNRLPHPPDEFGLHSTPLDESLIAMDKIIGKFRNDYKVDKVALIALTDGGSNGMRQHGDIWLKLGKNYVDCSGYGSREQKISLTGRLISYLKKRHGIQAIGFFLVRRYKDLYWHFNCPYDKVALAKKTFNKDKVLADKNTAYDKYFYVKADTAVKNFNLDEIKEDMKKSKIKTIFANSMKDRLVSRVLLQKFIKEVA